MAQVARNLTDAAAGPLTGIGYLIVDRDPLYTAHFRSLLQVVGVQLLRLPANSPNLDAYAERFVRSIKHECLRHIVPLGERHLRAVAHEFVEHYHAERNHQGLGNVIPFPSRDSTSPVGRIGRRERLGGVLATYARLGHQSEQSTHRYAHLGSGPQRQLVEALRPERVAARGRTPRQPGVNGHAERRVQRGSRQRGVNGRRGAHRGWKISTGICLVARAGFEPTTFGL
jgi:integrase-like protein